MKTVRAKNWKEYFKTDQPYYTELRAVSLEFNDYYIKRKLFSNFTIYFYILISSLLCGLYRREGMVAAATLILYALYLYCLAKSIANGIEIRRTAPAKANEGDTITVELRVVNTSSFTAKDLLIIHSFSGSLKPSTSIWISQNLPPGDFHIEKIEKLCDGGMGPHALQPITLRVLDPLGIFEFWVTEDDKKSIEVFPRLEAIPQIHLTGSNESFIHGLYEVQTRGGSLNFSGVRDYTRGDSLRHIAWKPSTRNSKLLVKEFEKVVDTVVSIFLDLDSKYQFGNKSNSTWEYAKKIALGIASQQIANGNQVQVLSNHTTSLLGRGDDHYHSITHKVFSLFPEADASNTSIIEKYHDLTPEYSTVIYIGSTFSEQFERTLSALLRLTEKKIHLIYILIDAMSFCPETVNPEIKSFIKTQLEKTKSKIDTHLDKLFEMGILVHMIQKNKNIGDSLLNSLI